jgi:hypothetical protein
MTLLQLFLIVLGLGVVAFLVNRFPWIESPFKEFIVWGLLVIAVVVVLSFFGVWAALSGVHGFSRS